MSLFSFIPKGDSFSSALAINKEAIVIASRCQVYKGSDFSSEKLTIEIEGQEILYRLKHKEIVDVLSVYGDFALVKTGKDIEGYVYKYYLTQNSSQQVYPVFNASIRNDTILYDMDFQNSGHAMPKGKRVFIYQSFNEKEEYTAVQVVLEDQSLYNGYISTKDLAPDGISGILIAGISIIAAAVTIVLSLLFMKKKIKKKLKKNK